MKSPPDNSLNPAAAERVLVALDFSPDSERALAAGLQFIGQLPVDLHLVHVHVPFEEGDLSRSDEKSLRVQMERIYTRISSSYPGSHRTRVTYNVERDIAPAAAVLRYAAGHNVDLIIAGTHGRRGFRRLILGSVAEEIVRLSHCTVLTVGGSAEFHLGTAMEKILVPIDFSEASSNTLSVCRELAHVKSAELELLHVVEEVVHPAFYNSGVFSVYDMRPDLDKKAVEELEKLYAGTTGPAVPVTFALRQGHAAREIVDHAEKQKADLIMMSTHGLTGLTHVLIGSVAEAVVRTAPCPVLIVPRTKPLADSHQEIADEMAA